MHLQPSELIAKTQAPDNNPQKIATYNTAPGTVVHLRNHTFVLVDAQTGHEQLRGDTTNPPVILFDPLDTDKENNND